MCDALPTITPAVQKLIDMEDDVVSAAQLAPILKMHPQTIVDRAKTGLWDQDRLGKFVISGDRVKFFRLDFLQKCGFIEPEPEGFTERQLLERIVQLLTDQNWMLMELLNKEPPAAATTDG